MTVAKLKETLQKLAGLGLYKLDGSSVVVAREKRKFFVYYLNKFEEGFSPNLLHFQQLLNASPIDCLMRWYDLPSMSDNIFASLLEKYLLYPKGYKFYLEHLTFTVPYAEEILKALFLSNELSLSFEEIEKMFPLTHEELYRALMFLELNFASFISYDYDQANGWKGKISPLMEWAGYLRHVKPKNHFSHSEVVPLSKNHVQSIKYRPVVDPLFQGALQRELLRYPKKAWVSLNDFIHAFSEPLSKERGIKLERQGRGWAYSALGLSEEEKGSIMATLLKEYAEQEIVSVGEYQESLCFSLTDFGYRHFS